MTDRFCRYCLSPNVASRRRYCCDEHRDATRRQNQSMGQRRARALRSALAASIAREQHRWRWRQIAMGHDEHLAVVFRPKRKRRARA